jgi:hypothetical protein
MRKRTCPRKFRVMTQVRVSDHGRPVKRFVLQMRRWFFWDDVHVFNSAADAEGALIMWGKEAKAEAGEAS